MNFTNFNLKKVENGWVVSENWEVDDKDGGTDYKDTEYVCTSFDEALEKVKELCIKWELV